MFDISWATPPYGVVVSMIFRTEKHGYPSHYDLPIKNFNSCELRQHRTMGAAGFGGSFAPIVQYEKWEIHPVFPHFPYFRSGQNLSPILLAPLCGVALKFLIEYQYDFAAIDAIG